MRLLLSVVFAACLPAFSQTDSAARLESLLSEAKQAQAENDYLSAADAYQRAAAIRPDLPEIWSNLGLMQYESHDYAQAETALRRALAINRSLFVPNLFLGLDLLELKRPREAIRYLDGAQKLNPRDTQVPVALGRAFHVLGDAAHSRDWYRRATDAAPANSDAWFGLGIAYLDLAESASETVKDDPRASAEVTELKTEGIAALARVVELQPESAKMHALLGDVYQRRRMFREAEEEYSKMLTLEPGSIGGLAGLAAAYLHDSRLDEAQATAQKALAREPADCEVNLLMGEILIAQHKYGDAEPYVKRGLNARPDLLARAHALLGRVYARTGRTKEAIDELNQGLSSDEDGSVYYQLARLYQSSGNTKAAAAAFEKSEQIRAKREILAQKNLESEKWTVK